MKGALYFSIALLAVQPVQAQASAVPQSVPAQPPAAPEIVKFESDPVMGLTVPIVVNGVTQRFLIDSGSERTAISSELAERLGMAPSGTVQITGLAGRSYVPTVVVPSLEFARGYRLNVQALLFPQYGIGADGFLGADLLGQQLVAFDFANNRMSLRKAPSVVAPPSRDPTVLLKMRLQNGRLIFTQARAGRMRIGAILDTGTTISIGNLALLKALASRKRLGKITRVTLLSVTGKPVPALLAEARDVIIGEAVFRNIPIAFAMVEPFVQLGFVDEPALLLGMDALRAFERVEIDFRNKQVSFTMQTQLGTPKLNIRGIAW